jgi:hypothetical protein
VPRIDEIIWIRLEKKNTQCITNLSIFLKELGNCHGLVGHEVWALGDGLVLTKSFWLLEFNIIRGSIW